MISYLKKLATLAKRLSDERFAVEVEKVESENRDLNLDLTFGCILTLPRRQDLE